MLFPSNMEELQTLELVCMCVYVSWEHHQDSMES